MIDTIHLKVWDIKKHDALYRNLLFHSKTKSKRFGLNENEPLKQPTHKRWLDRDIFYFEGTKSTIEKFSQHSHVVASWHYSISISVDIVRDFISINLSIPKYLFGTNIFQSLPHKKDKLYNSSNEFRQVETQIIQGRNNLRTYIQFFFEKEFSACKVYYDLVELARIDFCFNLVFPDKSSALSYLGAQKQVTKKYQRDSTDVLNNYQTSFFYRNADYSFKVYHKGTEYAMHDFNKHMRMNEVLKINYPCHDLQNFADRVLRFEMSFFSSYISKLWAQKIRTKRSGNSHTNKIWVGLKKVYNKLHYLVNDKKIDFINTLANRPLFNNLFNEVEAVKILKLDSNFHDYILQLYGRKNGDLNGEIKAYKCFYDDMNKFLTKKRKVWLKLPDHKKNMYEHYITNDYSFDSLDIHFSDALYKLLARKFWSICQEFKIQELPTDNQFKQSLLAYKSKKGYSSSVDTDKMLLIYKLISKGEKIVDIKSFLDMPKSSYYKYRKALNDCGLSQTAFINDYYKPFYDFSTYFLEVNQEKYKTIYQRSPTFL